MSSDPSPDLRAHGDVVIDRLANTSAARGPERLAGRLRDLGAILSADVAEVDRALSALAHADGDVAERAAGHLLHHPGKRIRATCALLAARLGDAADLEPATVAAAREAAIAAELVHAATLLHDDVIDEGTERRGVDASRVLYGNSASILGGDHLLVEALRRVDRAGAPVAMSELLATIAEMVAAEAFQLERRGDATLVLGEPREARRAAYLSVARGKTAALFRWALRTGGRLGGLTSVEINAIGEVGVSLGLAFQLVDDALDVDGDPELTGKNALADLREGKLTWPLLVALDRDPELAAMLARGSTDTRALHALAERIRATGAGPATRQEAAEHVRAGLAELAKVRDSSARRTFQAMVEGTIARAF